MRLFKRNKKIKGLISYYNLESFWLEALNDRERKIISENFNSGSIGSDSKDLLENNITEYPSSKLSFVKGQVSRYTKPDFKDIGQKFVNLGNIEVINTNNTLDKHFYYAILIKYYYRHRSESDNMEFAIKTCNDQISISKEAKKEFNKDFPTDSLPSHTGFEQLAIILEKSKKISDGIDLCNRALSEGWWGDWEHRIERMNKKIKNECQHGV
ncbi:hypothetical protein L3073_07530 [Ancylomarina sp. DW003]|nr:hypothetical protein [Ancylomarina sp. DW003]MDE5422057.1 hypothetical protein [Ancylomarina sp. DW003]